MLLTLGLTCAHPLQVSIEMMLLGEMLAISSITNKMVEQGDVSDAAYVCRAMADHGHQVVSCLSRTVPCHDGKYVCLKYSTAGA